MRVIGYLLGACIIMALLRLAVIVLLLALGVVIAWGMITRPRETSGLFIVLVICALVEALPG